jgi:hypothetical protein
VHAPGARVHAREERSFLRQAAGAGWVLAPAGPVRRGRGDHACVHALRQGCSGAGWRSAKSSNLWPLRFVCACLARPPGVLPLPALPFDPPHFPPPTHTLAHTTSTPTNACHQVLDVFGRVGGFNFLWAWTTGRAAGQGQWAGKHRKEPRSSHLHVAHR